MSERNHPFTTGVDSAPARPSIFRMVVAGVLLIGAVIGIAVWWNTNTANHTGTSAEPVQSNTVIQPEANTLATKAEPPPDAQTASPAMPPRGDLAAAIKQAQAEKSIPLPAPPPVGQSSWQGLSPKEAARVFEDAVKASSQTSPVSPFRHEQEKK